MTCLTPQETNLCQQVINHLTALHADGLKRRDANLAQPPPPVKMVEWVDPAVPAVAILVVSRNRPDLAQAALDQIKRLVKTPHDVYLVECGTEPGKLLPGLSSVVYNDPGFATGKAWCHNLAFQYARLRGSYTYYWLMMNDLVLDEDRGDPLATLMQQMESNPKMALLSPTNHGVGSIMPGARPRFFPQTSRQRWRKVAVVDYLGFLLRGSALEATGFLSPVYKWCWGTECVKPTAHRALYSALSSRPTQTKPAGTNSLTPSIRRATSLLTRIQFDGGT